MRDQNKRPSPPKENRGEKMTDVNACERNLCFRCLEPLTDKKEEIKGDFYCAPKCSTIIEKIL